MIYLELQGGISTYYDYETVVDGLKYFGGIAVAQLNRNLSPDRETSYPYPKKLVAVFDKPKNDIKHRPGS